MRRVMKWLALGGVGLVVTGALALVAVAETRWDRRFDAPFPEIHASSDPAVIERGRYLAYGPAQCVVCHSADDRKAAVLAGEEVPLVGGHEWRLPMGVIRSRNITPNVETGIGRYSDLELARILRHGVAPDGRAVLPFMPFQNMSDDDLRAVISFLRSQRPVHNVVPPNDVNLLGKAVLAMLIRPRGPSAPPPARSPGGATVERGRYLATSVADCGGCHTQRNMLDGSLTAPPFSGGFTFTDPNDPNRTFVSPNLTPDAATGAITSWSEDVFVARFRAGASIDGTPMPWRVLGRMTDDDLRAIYRYLRSLEPVSNHVGPTVRSTG